MTKASSCGHGSMAVNCWQLDLQGTNQCVPLGVTLPPG